MATNESKALTAAPTNAVAKQDPIKEMLFSEDAILQMKRALPKHLTPDRMARLALTELRRSEKLMKCSPQSIMAAVIQCSQLGLEFGGVLGQAYLVPYKTEATLIIGYKGLAELARRSGQVVNIMAEVVCEKDVFEYEQGLSPKLVHKPARGDRGEITDAYAVAWFKDGSKQFVVMSRHEIENIRNGSSGYKMAKQFKQDSPWDSHFGEMAKKTTIRRLSKQLPLSPEIRTVLEQADQREEGQEPFIDVPFESISDGEGRTINPNSGEVIEDAEFVETEDAPKAWAKLNEIGHPIEMSDPNGWSGKFPSVDEFEMMQPDVRKTWEARVERAIAIANGQGVLPFGDKY